MFRKEILFLFGDLKLTKIATVYITSFAGCIGGEHYTAIVRYGDERVEAKYAMDESQTRDFNKKYREDAGATFGRFRVGQMTTRFWTKEAAYARCIEIVREKWPNVKLILDGYECNPSKPIWCSSKRTQNMLNRMYLKAEAMYTITFDPFRKFPKESSELWSKWRAAMNYPTPKEGWVSIG